MVRHRESKGGSDKLWPITDLGGVADDIWDDGTWIGQLRESDLIGADHFTLVDGDGFSRARLLVWTGDQARGFVEVPVTAGAIESSDLAEAAAELPTVPARDVTWELPPMTVVICTRDRPDRLESVLDDLVNLDYPQFDILVVDNNPASGLTAPVVAEFEARRGPPIQLIDAVGQGLSIARNVAITNATNDIVAFTDDDVVVDRLWLENLAFGFGRDERVACVCGMVPSAELLTPSQSYFDRRVGWARLCEPAVYDLTAPPADDPLFPMRVAQFGTGANFAVRRDVIVELGGFDEGMGIGSPSGGGEDIDMFVRVLLGGHLLVREPSAVVWHKHRRTGSELELQVRNYGLGLGAWIAKLARNPRTLVMATRRAVPAVQHLRHVTVVDHSDNGPPDSELAAMYGREFRGVLSGPFALMSARMAGRKAAPLKRSSGRLAHTFDFRRDQNWGDPGNSIAAGRLSMAAVVLSLIGSLGAIPVLPTALLAIAVGAFLLAGPGCLAMSFYTHIDASILLPLVPAVSVAVHLIVVSGLLMLGFYNPVVVLLGLTVATTLGGLAHCGYLARRTSVGAP